MSKHYETRYRQDFIAKLREHDGQCEEVVFHKGAQIHRAQFPSSNLGEASRGEYLRCMVASVAKRFEKDDAQAMRVYALSIGAWGTVINTRTGDEFGGTIYTLRLDDQTLTPDGLLYCRPNECTFTDIWPR